MQLQTIQGWRPSLVGGGHRNQVEGHHYRFGGPKDTSKTANLRAYNNIRYMNHHKTNQGITATNQQFTPPWRAVFVGQGANQGVCLWKPTGSL